MKNKELIKKLSKLPMDAEVTSNNDDWMYCSFDEIFYSKKENEIKLG